MPLLVETRIGRVRGRLDRGVTVFRGIPYAAPRVGALRFKAPARLATLGSRAALVQSEDCLRLDLSTRNGASGTERRSASSGAQVPRAFAQACSSRMRV